MRILAIVSEKTFVPAYDKPAVPPIDYSNGYEITKIPARCLFVFLISPER